MTQKKLLVIIMVVLCAVVFNSCASNVEISPTATVEELTRTAQEYYDKGLTKKAETCYNAAISRAVSDPLQLLFVEYELAHMYIKEKKFDIAKPILERLMSYYTDSNDSAMVFPPEYKKLIEMDLAKIPAEPAKTVEK